MCLAMPMKIISINGTTATVEAMGVEQRADISLIENPAVDDKVIIHAGFAIEKLDSDEAVLIEKTWKEYTDFIEENNKE